jgi:hypothetical protein
MVNKVQSCHASWRHRYSHNCIQMVYVPLSLAATPILAYSWCPSHGFDHNALVRPHGTRSNGNPWNISMHQQKNISDKDPQDSQISNSLRYTRQPASALIPYALVARVQLVSLHAKVHSIRHLSLCNNTNEAESPYPANLRKDLTSR